MRCYKNGDLNRGGFRFLSNGAICIDICEENEPYSEYFQSILRYINEYKIQQVYVCSQVKEKIDISFLEEICLLKNLQITAKCQSLESVYKIQPEVLHIQNQDFQIDYDRLKENLTELNVYSFTIMDDKFACDERLLTCKNLKRLSVSNFSKKDLEVIKSISWLEDLTLADCKEKIDLSIFDYMTDLKSLSLQRVALISLMNNTGLMNLHKLSLTQVPLITLKGIENIFNLKYIDLNYCPSLIDISQIAKCSNIEIAKFEADKKIENFTILSSLKKLRALMISNCGKISSLQFLDELSELLSFSFVGTNIEDGNLYPCMRLKCVGATDKQHYNIKAKDLPKDKNYAMWKFLSHCNA